jgi:hypothetical protein
VGLVVALTVGLVLSLDQVDDDERDKEERKCRRHFDKVRATPYPQGIITSPSGD